MHVRATGDIHIDDHHTNEDVALAIGTVLKIETSGNFLMDCDDMKMEFLTMLGKETS